MLGAYIFTIFMSSSWIDPLIIMQCPSLSLIIFILRSIFSDMRIVTSAYFIYLFFASHLHGIYIFLSSHFQSICVLMSEVVFLQTAYIWVCFCIHSASLCLLVGAFNLFTYSNNQYICSYCHFLYCLGFDCIDLFLLLCFLTV